MDHMEAKLFWPFWPFQKSSLSTEPQHAPPFQGPAWFGPAPGPCAIAAPGPSTTSVTDGGQRSPSWSRRSAATSTRPKSPRAHGHAADGSKVGCPFGSLGHWRHGFKKLRWSPERQMGCCLVFMATKFCKEFEDEKKKVVWFKCCIIWLGKPVPEWHQVTMIAGQGPDGP